MFELKEILPNIHHIEFESQYTMSLTCCRIQEFYESPHTTLNGKYFDFETLMDVQYETTGGFTYLSDWSGFNFPDWIIKDFFSKFKDLTRKEKNLFLELSIAFPQTFKNKKHKKIYFIASIIDDKDTLSHELAHSFYYIDKHYRREMIGHMKPKSAWYKAIIDRLGHLGYGRNVLDDELQAYLATGTNELGLDDSIRLPKTFERTFNKFLKKKK